MKKVLGLVLLFGSIANAQIVNIPDMNFKAELLASSTSGSIAVDANMQYITVDTNGDGEIQVLEALQVYRLDPVGHSITSLEGIQSFLSLRQLFCTDLSLTTLDVSNLSGLEFLDCRNNSISYLDVSGMPNLQTVICSYNQMTTLNISNCPAMIGVDCGNNNISVLDLTGKPNLDTVYCEVNQIPTLDISGSPLLRNLSCRNNLLTTLDLTNHLALTDLNVGMNLMTAIDVTPCLNLVNFHCAGLPITVLDLTGLVHIANLNFRYTQITTIDLSHLPQLTYLTADGNLLTALDVTQNPNLCYFSCSDSHTMATLYMKNGEDACYPNFVITGNTNLSFVCADSSEVGYFQNYFSSQVGSIAAVSSYCTFVPGGNYNTISGNLTFDYNNNGCDSGDLNIGNIRVNINDGNTLGASFSDPNGNCVFYTQAGSFDIAPAPENPTWFSVSPASVTIPFADNNNNVSTQHFCLAPVGSHQDLEIVLVPITPARPGFDAVYKIVFKNKGNQYMNDWTGVSLQYDATNMSFVSASQASSSSSAGLLGWGYFLAPFQTATIEVVFHINTPTDVNNPVVNGDVLTFTATFDPIVTDENPADNTFVYHQTVVGSLDPNTIECLEGAVVAPTEIGDYLHYAINFENTGTYPAENIVVKTEIDPAKFDISTLQFLNASNPVQTRITGNVVEFIFENINLGIGGHGHILLKLKTNPNLVTGDSVSKRADIFFDYNFPVDTGLANTVFQTLSNAAFETDASVAVFPNPTTDFLNVSANSDLKSIELFDVQGRILQMLLPNTKETKVTMTSLPRGIYFVRATTAKGVTVQKIQKK